MEGSATASKRTKECVASSSTYFHERTWWRSWHWADFLALVQMRSGVMWREKSFSAMVLEGVCMCVAVAPTFGVQLLTEWVSDAMSLLLIVPPDELISIFGCFLFNLTFRFISAGRQVRWEEVFPCLDHLMLRPWPPSSHSSWGTIDFFLIIISDLLIVKWILFFLFFCCFFLFCSIRLGVGPRWWSWCAPRR